MDRRPDDTGIFQYRTDPTTIKGLKTKGITNFSGHATNITKTFDGLVDDIVRVLLKRKTRVKEDAKILREYFANHIPENRKKI